MDDWDYYDILLDTDPIKLRDLCYEKDQIIGYADALAQTVLLKKGVEEALDEYMARRFNENSRGY